MTEGTGFRATLLVLCNALILAVSSPVYMPQFLPGGTGRNIRNLPCVSRRTGETGICMFAFTCVKANGTHLGTCIDSFYFGSCCKIDGEPDIFPHDNTIDDGPVKPYPTNHVPVAGNHIPEYTPKPTPKPTKTTVKVTESSIKTSQTQTTTQKPVKASAKPISATTRPSVSKPVRVSLNSTNKHTTRRPETDSTTDAVGLSTFQTVQNDPLKTPTTLRPVPAATTKPPQKVTTTVTGTTNAKPRPPATKPTSNIKPTQKPITHNTTKVETKPTNKPSVNKPSSVKPTVSPNTTQGGGATTNRIRTTTEKPIATTPNRPTISGTRFPPRNSTTTTTVRPTRPTFSRPTSTITKKPATPPVKKITTTSTTPTTPVNRRPVPSAESATVASRPSTVASRPSTVASRPPTGGGILNVTNQAGGSFPTKVTTAPNIPHGGYKPATPGQRPSETGDKPTTATTTVGVKRPSTPSNKPSSTSSRPGVVGASSRPTATTLQPPVTRPRPVTTQVYEALTTIAPLEKPTRATTISTTVDAMVTRRPVSSSTQPRPTSSTITSLSTSSISNEVISSDDTTNGVQGFDTSKFESTSYSPGLVTWTSNSDDATTRSPGVQTSTTEPEEPTNTEWTPITTPDGWILIQSPSPNEPDKNQGDPTVRPTTQPPVSDKPTTVASSTTERSTTRPSLPTVATTSSTTDNYIPTAELNMSDYKQVCGRRLFPESRIVGGARSSFGRWPWQISLRQWRTSTYLHKCGAALLNENWAITAAHCVENVPPSDLLLRLGEHDLASEDEPYGFQERRVQIVASHPQFDPRTFEYDLALLRFYEPLLPFQPNTLPICLPDDDANYVGLTAHVTGWGRLYEDGPLPSVLQEVPVPVINNTVCEAMYRSAGYIEHIPKIFICAGWRKGGFDSCEGDSGGPLVIQRPRDKRWILAGVISWGIGCAEPNQPGVYTRISEFREWINQILQF